MTAILSENKETLGYKAFRLRVSQNLTQKELAKLADVLQEEVNTFEQGLPVQLDVRRKILKELWDRKAKASII